MTDFRELIDRIMDFLAPPRCIVCNEIIEGDNVLCDVCRQTWEKEKLSLCPVCSRPHCECRCPISAASPSVDALTLGVFHLAPYYSGNRSSAGNLLVFEMKTKDYARLHRLIAFELADRISWSLAVGENSVVTYVPRTRSKIREYGMDQSERLSKYVAVRLGLQRVLTLKNVSKTLQKELTQNERFVNAASAYRLLDGAEELIKDKIVIIIDDVITTGASMLAAADILAENGAKGLIFASVLRTQSAN